MSINPPVAEISYECSEAASAGGDLELAVEVPNSSGGEKALDQQQHSKHKESSCETVDDVLQDVDTVGTTQKHSTGDELCFRAGLNLICRINMRLQSNYHV